MPLLSFVYLYVVNLSLYRQSFCITSILLYIVNPSDICPAGPVSGPVYPVIKICLLLQSRANLPTHAKTGTHHSFSDTVVYFIFPFLLHLNAIPHDTAKPPQRPTQPITIRIIALVLILQPPSVIFYPDLHILLFPEQR